MQGFPMSAFYQVHKRKALVIGISDYSELRELPGLDGFADLEEVKKDVKVVEQGLRRLGFERNDIVTLLDPMLSDIKIETKQLAIDVIRSQREGENTLIFCYYAGHGCQENFTKILLNSNHGAFKYPLEKILRDIACTDGSYVISLFDCCRERLPQELMRGLGAVDEDEDFINEPVSSENLIITFGCMPSDGVPAKSTISKAYFRHLRHSARV